MNRLLLFVMGAVLLMTSCNQPNVEKELFDDGSVKLEKTFENIDGKAQLVKEIAYHPNGQKYMEGAFKDELREGKWTSWYEDGTLWSEGDFKAGESQGVRNVYHPNGQLHYKGTFDNGERTGAWTYYDEVGNKTKEINYDKAPEENK